MRSSISSSTATSGWIYRGMVGQLSTGACLEPATAYIDIVTRHGNPRHSH